MKTKKVLVYTKRGKKVANMPSALRKIEYREIVAEWRNRRRPWCNKKQDGWFCTRGKDHPGLCMSISYLTHPPSTYATWRPDDSD